MNLQNIGVALIEHEQVVFLIRDVIPPVVIDFLELHVVAGDLVKVVSGLRFEQLVFLEHDLLGHNSTFLGFALGGSGLVLLDIPG